jgi:CO/xanthine dehydrogenase Mo-binding subunit
MGLTGVSPNFTSARQAEPEPDLQPRPSSGRLPRSIAMNPDLDRWVEFRADTTIVIRTGKAELGQGIRTALAAIAADELNLDPAHIVVEGAATDRSPNEGITAGSGSIEQSGAAVRQAAAQARAILMRRGADHLGVPVNEVTPAGGWVTAPDGRSVGYAELAAGRPFQHRMTEAVPALGIRGRRWVGRGLPRLDLPAKVRGEAAFVHDLRPDGTRHARPIRPPRPGARLTGVDPSVLASGSDLVRSGSFLAVVADRLSDAVNGAQAIARAATWAGGDEIATGSDTAAWMTSHVASSVAIVEGAAADDDPGASLDHAGAARVLRAAYRKPFLLHGSLGPSAAVARFDPSTGRLDIRSHSQGVEILRHSIAELVGLEPQVVDVTHVDGAGAYGHNGADDAAADAALVAMARPGEAISLGWSRADEHRFEPASPAMVVALSAGLDGSGRITSWDADIFSYPHGARPRPMGNTLESGFLPAWYLDPPRAAPPPGRPGGFHSGGHRNADPLYAIPERRVVHHLVAPSPVRTSSTRALGAFANVFAIESFMDELAVAAEADPIEFRLAHLTDERARAVIEAVRDASGGLTAPGGVDAPGRGLAFARYENVKAYCAVLVELDVSTRTGEVALRHAWIAADAGQTIDPDGLANQLEGGFVQAASWTLKERLDLGPEGPVATDWDGYPILRFTECPTVDVLLIDHPTERSLGAGEAVTGPTAAAIANAVAQVTGVRVRDLPIRRVDVPG